MLFSEIKPIFHGFCLKLVQFKSVSLCKTAVVNRVTSNAVYSSLISFANKQEELIVCMQCDLIKATTKVKETLILVTTVTQNHGEERNANNGGYGFPNNMSSSSIASSSEDKCGGGGNKFIVSLAARSPCALHPISTALYAIICCYHTLKHEPKIWLNCTQTKAHTAAYRVAWAIMFTQPVRNKSGSCERIMYKNSFLKKLVFL